MPVKTPISVEDIKDKLRFLYEVVPLSIPEELKPRFDVYTEFGFCEATANYLLAPKPPDSTRFSEMDYREDNPYPQSSTTGLRYIRIPSTPAEGGVKQWIPLEIDLDFQQEISAFRLDECLMVLIVVILTQVGEDEFDVSLHLLNFPDCTPSFNMDPIDLEPVFSYELRDAMEQRPMVVLATYEHQIGVLIRGKVSNLYLYDWPSGTLRMHLVHENYDSFSFVKANTIIVSNDMCLDIWTIDTIPKKRRPTKLCSLALPDESAGCSVQFVSSMKRCMKTCCRGGDDIVAIRLVGSSIGHFVIIPAFLYSIAAKFRSRRPSPSPVFPWTEWGPQNSASIGSSIHSTSSLAENRYAVLDQSNKENLAMFYFSCWGKHDMIASTTRLINLTIDADYVLLVPRKVIGVKWIGRFSTLDVCCIPINPSASYDSDGGTETQDSDDSES